jgi:Na+-transporting methylmalonyl-CoA/oxaloacetate decarboxylase gamma subunit
MKLVGDGFVLLVLGQAVVFLFIFLMVAFINVNAALLKRFKLDKDIGFVEEEPVVESVDDAAEIAAAVAATQTFRANS